MFAGWHGEGVRQPDEFQGSVDGTLGADDGFDVAQDAVVVVAFCR
jgi:hypothetical protein